MIYLDRLLQGFDDEFVKQEVISLYEEIKKNGLMSYNTNETILSAIDSAKNSKAIENKKGE